MHISSSAAEPTVAVIGHSMMTRVEGGARHPAISDKVWGSLVHVLCQPGSNKSALESALRGFHEFAAKHPTAKPLVQARMQALGAVVGQIQDENKKRRRKKD
jgi:hypothetical protein